MNQRRVSGRGKDLTVIQGEGRRYSHIKQAAVYYFTLALIAVLVGQAGYHWIKPLILAHRLQIVTADIGYFDQTVVTAGVVTRHEQLVCAPASGVVVDLAPAGARIAVGKELLTILLISREEILAMREPEETSGETLETLWEKLELFFRNLINGESDLIEPDENLIVTGEIPPWYRETVTVTGETAGFLSYSVDGWESLCEEAFLTEETFLAAPAPSGELVEGQYVEAGAPLLKVVNNWHWYYHVIVPLEEGRAAAARENVTITFDFAPDIPVEAVLDRSVLDAAAGSARLTYRMENELPGFDRARWNGASILLQREKGIIIPAAALTVREGQAGVYINNGGYVIFNPVTVIAEKGDEVMVTDLDQYKMVICQPEMVREGQRLN